MEKFYQVFVSSTFSDLENERKKVSDSLAKAGMIPAGMELFPATSLKQLEFIKKVIDRCDYYVVIVGARYGSLDGDKSFTEKEYEYALSKNIPVLAFIHKTPGKIAADKTESDPALIKKLDEFRERLKNGRVVYFWIDINDLCMNVVITVASEINLSPGIGWVRGDQAIDPKILQEMEKTRIENERLRQIIEEFQSGDISFPEDLSGPDDNIAIKISFRRANQTQVHEKTISVTPRFLFETVVDYILREVSESVLSEHFVKTYVKDSSEPNPRVSIGGISADDLKKLRFHLEALGLIKAQSRQGDSSKYIAWTITDKGRRFISKSKAIQKPST